MLKANPKDTALTRALSKHLVLKASELTTILGSRAAIKRHLDAGHLQYLGSGYYTSEAVDPFTAGLIVVGRYYAKAVVSNLTALLFHKLSDEPVDAIDVDIDKRSTLRNRILRVHRVTPETLCGVAEVKVQKAPVRIYDVERALCDAYKIDPGGAIFFKALKRYTRQYEVNTKLIKQYDEMLRTKVLSHLKQELADE